MDEIPYDFIRKRLSILVSKNEGSLMVMKGALPNVLEVCSSAETAEGRVVELVPVKEQILRHFAEFRLRPGRDNGHLFHVQVILCGFDPL